MHIGVFKADKFQTVLLSGDFTPSWLNSNSIPGYRHTDCICGQKDKSKNFNSSL